MQVTMNLDILQLKALHYMTGRAVEDALRDYNKYLDDYHHRVFMRAQDLHDEIDAVFVAQCNKIDEVYAIAKAKTVAAKMIEDLPF